MLVLDETEVHLGIAASGAVLEHGVPFADGVGCSADGVVGQPELHVALEHPGMVLEDLFEFVGRLCGESRRSRSVRPSLCRMS